MLNDIMLILYHIFYFFKLLQF